MLGKNIKKYDILIWIDADSKIIKNFDYKLIEKL